MNGIRVLLILMAWWFSTSADHVFLTVYELSLDMFGGVNCLLIGTRVHICWYWDDIFKIGIILTHWGRDKMDAISQTMPFHVHFPEWKCMILLKISLKFVPKVRINNIPALDQIMAWRRPGDKPLSGPMIVSLLTQICVTRLQWVKFTSLFYLATDVRTPCIARWSVTMVYAYVRYVTSTRKDL